MYYDYLLWLLVFVYVPIGVLIFKFHSLFRKYVRTFLIMLPGIFIVSGVWDYLAINTFQIWVFPTENILGLWFLGIPLEEWIFFFSFYLFAFVLTVILGERDV